MAILEKGMNGPFERDQDYDAIGTLNEMDFIACNHNEYVVPCDVAKVWKEINDDRFKAYRKKASWVWKCINWVNDMYGFAYLDVVLKLVNVKKGIRIDAEELREIFERFPDDEKLTYFFDDLFIASYLAENIKALERLRNAQAGKDYYIPSSAEVEEYADTGALISGKEYQNLQCMVENDLGYSHEDATELMYELWDSKSSIMDTINE